MPIESWEAQSFAWNESEIRINRYHYPQFYSGIVVCFFFIFTNINTYFPDLWMPPGSANRELRSSEFLLEDAKILLVDTDTDSRYRYDYLWWLK